jgi:DNA (cytosine-5)-methyltransferase 1
VDITKELPTVISFCSGYGGIERGLDLAGVEHRVIAFLEIEAFAIANLVNKMERGLIPPAPVYTDITSFPAEIFRDRVDIVTGGYPCQPFSKAGSRKGADDPRHLWPFIRRHLQSIRPLQCFFENVEGHISLGLSSVISDLEEDGYRSTWGIFSAREVGAPHQRKRVFIMGNAEHDGSSDREKPRDIDKTISNCTQGQDQALKSERASRPSGDADLSRGVADSDSVRCDGRRVSHGIGEREVEIETQQGSGQPLVRSEAEGCGGDGGDNVADTDNPRQRPGCGSIQEPEVRNYIGGSGEELADTESLRVQGLWPSGEQEPRSPKKEILPVSGGERRIDASWPTEPNVGRVVDGCPDRVDRIRLLGNAVLPKTAAKAWITLSNRYKNEQGQ